MTKPKRLIGREILKRPTLKTVREPVPEWDSPEGPGEIILRALSGTTASELNAYGSTIDPATDKKASLKLAAWALVHSWIDEGGELVLAIDDIDTLLDTQGPSLLNRLGTRILQISSLTNTAIESAAKNSESSQSNDSGTP